MPGQALGPGALSALEKRGVWWCVVCVWGQQWVVASQGHWAGGAHGWCLSAPQDLPQVVLAQQVLNASEQHAGVEEGEVSCGLGTARCFP